MIEKKAKGGNGGGSSDIDIISSRNTIEVSRSGNTFDVNVADNDARNFYVKDFHEFMDAVKMCGQYYIDGDTVQNVIQLLDHIDMTIATADDEANYVLTDSNGTHALIDLSNKRFDFGMFLFRTKIISYGQRRALQLFFPQNNSYFDTWQISVERFFIENIALGGEIAIWRDYFKHSVSSGTLPVQYQRYLLHANGNLYYEIDNCTITCCGADQDIVGSFNPWISMGNATNQSYGQWNTALYVRNCVFVAGVDSGGSTWGDLNAPIVINSDYRRNRQKVLQFKQLSKQVNATAKETGVPNIQLSTSNPADVQTNWETYKWEVSTDGTALVTCSVSKDCLILKPRLALNDIYLEGTPLTPAGNPPTEDYVSLVSLLQNMGEGVVITPDNDPLDEADKILGQRQNELGNGEVKSFGMWNVADFIRKDIGLIEFYIYDAYNNDSRLILIDEVKSDNNSAKQLNGIVYYNVSRDNVVDGCIQKIYVSWNHGSYSVRTDLLNQNGEIIPIKPCIVQYQSKYYIALQQFGKYSSIYFLGRQTLGLRAHQTPTTLYYDSNTEKWYSDRERTSEVAVTFYADPERFPADNLDFGGTSSQVVAGDGSFLSWDSKLGYWEGTQQAYNDLPADQKDIPNVLYVID